jgi:hypothetical protein
MKLKAMYTGLQEVVRMATVDLESTAQAFVAEGKGILVADETPRP